MTPPRVTAWVVDALERKGIVLTEDGGVIPKPRGKPAMYLPEKP